MAAESIMTPQAGLMPSAVEESCSPQFITTPSQAGESSPQFITTTSHDRDSQSTQLVTSPSAVDGESCSTQSVTTPSHERESRSPQFITTLSQAGESRPTQFIATSSQDRGSRPTQFIATSSQDRESLSPRLVSSTPRDGKLFQCGLCGVAYSMCAELIAHLEEHTLIKPFQCKHCRVGYNSSRELEEHVRTHQAETDVIGSFTGTEVCFVLQKTSFSYLEKIHKKDAVSCLANGDVNLKGENVGEAEYIQQRQNTALENNVSECDREKQLPEKNASCEMKVEDASDAEYNVVVAFPDYESDKDSVSENESTKQTTSPNNQNSQKITGIAAMDRRSYSCEICGAAFRVARYVGDHKRIVHKIYNNKTSAAGANEEVAPQLLEDSAKEKTQSPDKKIKSPSNTGSSKVIPKSDSYTVESSVADLDSNKRVTRSSGENKREKIHIRTTRNKKSKGPYECSACGKMLKTERNLKNHFTAVHSDKRPFPCPICPSRFKTKGHMNDHVASVHEGKRPFPCPHCPSEFKSKHWLTVHVQKHHSVGDTNTGGSKSARKINHSPDFVDGLKKEGPFKCSVCEKILLSERNLKNHMVAVHSGERPFPCPICPSRFKTKAHMSVHVASVHEGHRPFPCPHCPSQFKSKRWLSMHIARRHPSEAPPDSTKPVLCHVCGRSCSSVANMKRHLQTHSVDRPYKCSQCDAAYRIEKLLEIHMRKHTGEKPYTCEFCGESFARHNIFTYHRNRHLDTRPIRCDICQKGFNSHPALWQHKRRHLGDKRYPCNQCDGKFYNLWSLKRHQVTHTDLRPLSCKKCSKTYRSYSSLKFHQKRHHPEI
ncbi:zinc finger protein 37 homolog [Littorina saxatilis]|uniref:zinc finger protein 37 homolog n=1 Tax=Littorina saxatilis TaxID=31220 RepID=UPI0038B666C4